MPKWKDQDPKETSYVLCEKCSDEKNEPVVYYQEQIKHRQSFYGRKWLECPKGHELPPATPPAA